MAKVSGGKFLLGVIRACRQRDIDPARPGHRTCLYDSKANRLLGRHRNRASAVRQERAIQIRKHAQGRKGK